jgi:SAM-dependent methyltransferase
LVARGCRVDGIELDPIAAELAAQHCERVHVADVDLLEELPWTDTRYDTILCMDILEHLRDPWRALRVLREGLTPDGRMIVTLPNVANWWIRFRLLRGRWNYDDIGIMDRTHLRFFTVRTARELLASAGLSISEMDVTPGVGAWAPYHYTIGALLRLFGVAERADYRLSRLVPTLFAYQLLFVTARGERPG